MLLIAAIAAFNDAMSKGEAIILKNNALMQQLGLAATPSSFTVMQTVMFR